MEEEPAMNTANFTWPKKTREIQNHHFDSTIWNNFNFRDDDIIVASYAKSGTTWMQQIIAQLLFNCPTDLDVAELSPWVDLRIPPKEVKLAALEAQTHRRFLKTHLPVDALVFSPKAKYIYVARDGRDVLWSLYNHHSSANAGYYRVINDSPGRVGPPLEPPTASVRQYYHEWLDKNGAPYWPFWENIKSWWDIRHLPNVFLVHFAKLKEDIAEQIRSVAAFLEIPVDNLKWDLLLHHCSFEFMKLHAGRSVPLGGAFWDKGSRTFFHRGVNGRWRDVLSPEESGKYEKMAREKLGEDCAFWLATGELPTRVATGHGAPVQNSHPKRGEFSTRAGIEHA